MFILAVIVINAIIAIADGQSYRAGIVLYKLIEDNDHTPDELLRQNVNNVIKLIDSSKDKPDIVVVPEYGLTNIKAKSAIKQRLEPFSTKIGKVGEEVCGKNMTKGEQNLVNLACAARNNSIHLIVNLIESEGENFYLTNVGFDTHGSICLKCREEHLSNNSVFEKASNQNCSFTAMIQNEAVKFSVLYGSDIFYPIPEAVKSDNVIMTSSVLNNIPLNFGVSLYQGFAISQGVNLVVADYTDVSHSYGGSGIFYSNGTSVIAFGPEKVPGAIPFAQGGASTIGALIIRDIPVNTQTLSPVKATNIGLPPKMNSLQYINIPGINDTSKNIDKTCVGEKCCSFKSELTSPNIEPYKWIVFLNTTTILEQEMEIFLCALVVPSVSFVPTSFKSISIYTNIKKAETKLTLPITLNQHFLPTNFVFNKNDRSIVLNHEENIVVFGIIEILDGSATPSGSNTTLIVIVVLLCLILVALLVAFFVWRKRQAKNRGSF